MKFSEEELKEINSKIKQAEELQLRNGNKTYTMEEMIEIINNMIGEKQYL